MRRHGSGTGHQPTNPPSRLAAASPSTCSLYQRDASVLVHVSGTTATEADCSQAASTWTAKALGTTSFWLSQAGTMDTADDPDGAGSNYQTTCIASKDGQTVEVLDTGMMINGDQVCAGLDAAGFAMR